jgi:hypothetical protein
MLLRKFSGCPATAGRPSYELCANYVFMARRELASIASRTLCATYCDCVRGTSTRKGLV